MPLPGDIREREHQKFVEDCDGNTAVRVKLSSGINIVLSSGPTPRGEYDPATQYNIGDLVELDGSSYLATEQTIGNAPPGAQWQLVAAKGDDGEPGPAGPPGPPGTGSFASEVVAVTTSPNAWTNVPLSAVLVVGNAQVYDDSNKEIVDIEIRIPTPSTLEIRSNITKTYSVRVVGA